MALPHPAAALAVGAAAVLGSGTLATTLAQDHGVPERAAVAYVAAARSAPCPIDYRILVAIGRVESGHGTHDGASIDQAGKITKPIGSYAGAQGPMQFMPATWDAYGVDGDGDGTADINDIDDAAAGAANYLCANGVAADRSSALYNYNHDASYVAGVEADADKLPGDDGSTAGEAPTPPDKGRICGVGEWVAPDNDCFDEARAKAAYLWADLGVLLGQNDTPRLRAVWQELNGQPAQPAAQPVSYVAAKTDVPGLPDSAGLDEAFAKRLARLARDAPGSVTINSGYRSTAEQVAIIESHGGECGYMVACVVDGVCKSMHCQGKAADLEFGDGLTDQWVHANMGRYQLCQPMDYEPWHLQPAETCG